jgi:hypothetical protein
VSAIAAMLLPTITVTVAVLQLAGTTFNPVTGFASHNWYVIVYVPDGVFGAKVNTPLASILNGPVVIGVTFELAAVTTNPFKVSLLVTFPTVVATVVLEACVGYVVSAIAAIALPTTIVTVAELQLAGTTFNPVTGFASHNWYVIV